MNKIIFLVFLFIVLSCSKEDDVKLVSYSIEYCNEQQSVENLSSLRNRITDYSRIGDTTLIQVSFVENCGFVVDPEVTLNNNNLLIEADQFFDDSTRMALFCTCCHSFEMKILGIKEKEQLNYFLKLSSIHPEKISVTDSIYNTYQVDYLIIESDTIYYPKSDDIYVKRVYEREDSDGYTYSYFPDNGHLHLNKVTYKAGERLQIHNDFYRITDTLDQIIEKGRVDYLILEKGKGVEAVLSKM